MTAVPELSVRQLTAGDLASARRLAERSGVHGVYVHNALEPGTGRPDAELLGFHAVDELVGLAFFGSRGNLIVIEGEALDPQSIATSILASKTPWRIALGSKALLAALAERETLAPLVHRTQAYYGVRQDELAPVDATFELRVAARADTKALVQAALELNQSDLNVQSWRVNKGWLKESVKRRIREGRTFVCGPGGAPWCKVDIGSLGSSGAMLEGVFTMPEMRGRRLARQLVGAVAADFLTRLPLVCLHVGADNYAARRAYVGAGMRALGECSLLLRG